MPRIKQLSPEEAQKIAAGEVIERPANVVKELIENALDAGATRITLYIEKAGKKLIRIVDDGCGMDAQDARACFKHHATSKITSVNDLHTISTFGFRGEALSSIASVSNVTLTTKTADAPADAQSAMAWQAQTTTDAIKLELSEGRILSEEKTSAPQGTDLAIRDILFNVPVRKKFLKTDDTEWRHILHLVHAVALSRRDIHITLHHDRKQVLNCPPVTDYLARAAQLWDSELAHAMIPCAAEERGIRIEGMISDHTVYRYDRNALYFFVNGRWIKNYTLTRALMKGYANAIPASQYPTASLMITIDPAQIDVNIHPRKEEVQFLHQRIVDQVIQMAVKAALESRLSAQLKTRVHLNQPEMNIFHEMIHKPAFNTEPYPRSTPSSSFTPYDFTAPEQDGFPTLRYANATQGERTQNEYAFNDPFAEEIPAPNASHIVESPFASFAPQGEREKDERAFEDPFPQTTAADPAPRILEEKSLPLTEKQATIEQQHEQTAAVVKEKTMHTVLGIYDKTYIMVADDEGILFVDQHAAHERILYEQFKTRFADTAIITLMFPHALNFKRDALDLLEPYLMVLADNGIRAQRSGETELTITATPVYLKNASIKNLIEEMISCINEDDAISHETIKKQLTEKVHAQMACAAAVKAGDELSDAQIQQLLNDLANTPNKITCPHGRPTSWLLNHDEIVKRFQRDYISKR
jgi:DNA mismatch repair protein MutL